MLFALVHSQELTSCRQIWQNSTLALTPLYRVGGCMGRRWSACVIACHVANLSLCCILRATWTSKSSAAAPVFFCLPRTHTLFCCWILSHAPPQGCTALVTGGMESWQAAGSQGLREIPASLCISINALRVSWYLDDISVCVKGWGAENKPNLILSCGWFVGEGGGCLFVFFFSLPCPTAEI